MGNTSNMPDGDSFDGEMYSSSSEILSSSRYGEKRCATSLFQGLWNRIDLNYMRPLFGGPNLGPGSIMRVGSHQLLVPNQEDINALNEISE